MNPNQPTTLIDTFLPLLNAARGVDLSDPGTARAELDTRFDPGGEAAASLNSDLKELLDRGQIAERGELPVRFGRVTKACEESHDFSIDVVLMNGAGPLHRHPNGEVNYCLALEGTPTFDGSLPGWVVEHPGSQHVPTVANGMMLIVYLLPAGKIEFIGS